MSDIKVMEERKLAKGGIGPSILHLLFSVERCIILILLIIVLIDVLQVKVERLSF